MITCSRYFVINSGKYRGLNSEGPEFESLAGFTSRILNAELGAALKCVDLCNAYGMDTISTSGAISFVMECYDRGFIDKETTAGLDMSWGNIDAVVELIHQIGKKEKFGAVLANGILASIKALGPETEPYAMHGKGLDVFLGDARGLKGYGLGTAVASRGADHSRSEPFFETLGNPELGIEKFGMAETADRLSYIGKGKVVKHYEALSALADSLNVCKNTMVSMETLDFEDAAGLYEDLTGFPSRAEDMAKTGERIINVERLFNLLCGV
jgi:aldehyde:ferredoxin oxidoreductase